jgi:hypothetical protein
MPSAASTARATTSRLGRIRRPARRMLASSAMRVAPCVRVPRVCTLPPGYRKRRAGRTPADSTTVSPTMTKKNPAKHNGRGWRRANSVGSTLQEADDGRSGSLPGLAVRSPKDRETPLDLPPKQGGATSAWRDRCPHVPDGRGVWSSVNTAPQYPLQALLVSTGVVALGEMGDRRGSSPRR